jgi:murein DD-endopeptidase MepM/ murein hydrolase activator NlpD
MTSPFGWRTLNGTKDYHNGVDLVGEGDTTVIAPLDGKVIMSAYGMECGHQIQIYTRSGKTLFFCHLMNRAVKVGDEVKQGDKLGIMGATGSKCFGAHLHFGVYDSYGRDENKLIDPQKFLKF